MSSTSRPNTTAGRAPSRRGSPCAVQNSSTRRTQPKQADPELKFANRKPMIEPKLMNYMVAFNNAMRRLDTPQQRAVAVELLGAAEMDLRIPRRVGRPHTHGPVIGATALEISDTAMLSFGDLITETLTERIWGEHDPWSTGNLDHYSSEKARKDEIRKRGR